MNKGCSAICGATPGTPARSTATSLWTQAPERNSPGWLYQALQLFRAQGLFPEFPFGTDLTAVQQRLARALKRLKAWSRARPKLAARAAAALFSSVGEHEREALERMRVADPATLKERLNKALLLSALRVG